VGAEVDVVSSSRCSKLRLRLPELDGSEKSVNIDVIDVVLEASGNSREFCRVDGAEGSVSVSTTKYCISIIIITV
jgi:hypothetical protein